MTLTLAELAEKMRDIDFTMLSTRAEDGTIGARPMSNNRDVDYGGDSWFFTCDDTRTVADIARDPQVGLALQGKAGLLGRPPIFISVEGKAELIRDKAAFAAHWNKDLEAWFDRGMDTPGLVLIRVEAKRIHFWDGKEEGEVALAPAGGLPA
jgi:general stress protein 26